MPDCGCNSGSEPVKSKPLYSEEPVDKGVFTAEFDRFYTRFAKLYDFLVTVLPFWKRWVASTLPHISGPRVLEISFGTGYLLTQYARRFETWGLDYNEVFVKRVRQKLERRGIMADIRRGNVEGLPYPDAFFDSIVNTMAFTGYPDAEMAMSEMRRVLKRDGRLIIVDVNYPARRTGIGMLLTRFWMATGDIVRDLNPILERFGFEYTDREVGGWGSVHLYVARKR